MNDQLPPLPADQVLELLSAEIDGEFDAAATDLGLTPADARARLDATPGVAERRAALTGTRTALAVPELDEATRERLVSTALQSPAASDELSTRRARRSMGRVIGIAATIAAVVVGAGALAVVAGDNDNGDDASLTAEAPSADEESGDDDSEGDSVGGDDSAEAAEDDAAFDSDGGTAGAIVGAPDPYSYFLDFGDVTSPDALQAAVAGQLRGLAAQSLPATGEQLFDAPTTRFSYNAGCYAVLVEDFGLTPPPVMQGPAIYAGDSVQVAVFAVADGYQALVIGSECEVLDDQFVTPEP